MKRIVCMSFALAVGATLMVLIATTAPRTPKARRGLPVVYASTGCTDTTLSGNYAVLGPGFATAASNGLNQSVPIAIEGVLEFDGTGSVSFSFTLARSGTILQGLNSSGNYTVNSNCTGSISFTSGDAAGITFNMTIIGGGTEIFGIETNKTTVATFDAKKQ